MLFRIVDCWLTIAVVSSRLYFSAVKISPPRPTSAIPTVIHCAASTARMKTVASTTGGYRKGVRLAGMEASQPGMNRVVVHTHEEGGARIQLAVDVPSDTANIGTGVIQGPVLALIGQADQAQAESQEQPQPAEQAAPGQEQAAPAEQQAQPEQPPQQPQ